MLRQSRQDVDLDAEPGPRRQEDHRGGPRGLASEAEADDDQEQIFQEMDPAQDDRQQDRRRHLPHLARRPEPLS